MICNYHQISSIWKPFYISVVSSRHTCSKSKDLLWYKTKNQFLMYAYQRICFEKKLLQTFTPHNITYNNIVTGEMNALETSSFPWFRPSLVIFCILLFSCLMELRYSEKFSVAVPSTIYSILTKIGFCICLCASITRINQCNLHVTIS